MPGRPSLRTPAMTALRRSDRKASNAPEPDTRYATLLETFQAARKADPYSPLAPTLIARRFDENREIPEAQVRTMLEAVLSSPLVPRVAKAIEKRLGRRLEPFDIWYSGFKPRGAYTEAQLDAAVNEPFAQQSRTNARSHHQLDGAVLQHTGANAALAIFARFAFEHDRLDALQMQQVRQHQSRRQCDESVAQRVAERFPKHLIVH